MPATSKRRKGPNGESITVKNTADNSKKQNAAKINTTISSQSTNKKGSNVQEKKQTRSVRANQAASTRNRTKSTRGQENKSLRSSKSLKSNEASLLSQRSHNSQSPSECGSDTREERED